MATRDLVHNLKPTAMLVPVVRTSTVLSAALDTQGFESVVIEFAVGIYGDTASASVFIEAELQEADVSTYTAVADSDIQFPGALVARTGSVATSGVFFQSKTTGAADLGSKVYQIGYIGSKRYVKVNVRLTSPTNGAPVSVTGWVGHPTYQPAV